MEIKELKEKLEVLKKEKKEFYKKNAEELASARVDNNLKRRCELFIKFSEYTCEWTDKYDLLMSELTILKEVM